MQEKHINIARLLAKYPKLSQEEMTQLEAWRMQDNNQDIFQNLTDSDTRLLKLERYYQIKQKQERCKDKMNQLIDEQPQETAIISGTVISGWKTWRRYVAAASVLLLLSVSGYIIWYHQQESQVNKPIPKQIATTQDVAPGKYKARLTLSDGRTVVLDSAADGQLAQEGSSVVINKDGKLVYESSGTTSKRDRDVVLYNTLTTTKGETYVTELSDGSKVWLNSQSSIRYPVAFADKLREVEITGEAYFEVARDQKNGKPFWVHISPGGNAPDQAGMTVEVLGTHFNINAYEDEAALKTTLLEGKVRVVKGQSAAVLHPGQQAQLKRGTDQLATIDEADLDQAVAWKNGLFQFNHADLPTVLRQLVRWYDVEIVYQGTVPKHEFLGKIPRDMPLSQVLNLLQKQRVHFTIEGRKIIVSPK